MPIALSLSHLPRLRLPPLVLALAVATLGPGASAQLPDHPAIDQSPTPGWVLEQEITDPPAGEGQEIRYLLVDQQIRLRPGEPQEVYRRFTYRVEARTALEEWSSWQIAVEPNFEKLSLHDLRVKREGAWEDRLDRSRASLLQREAELEQQVFDGRQTLLLVFDDIRVGDVVDISYTMSGSNPLFGERFNFATWLGWSLPVARAHLRIRHPASRPLQVAALAGAAEPERTQDGETVILSWQLEDLDLIEGEPGTPSSTLSYPLVDVSEYKSWAEVAEWGVPIYRTQAAPELDELVAELKEKHEDPSSRLAAARNWVQDEVRYFAAVMGAHSHAPHTPSDILQRRYGDCKDKTLLLLHLLDRLDIPAWPALVHSERGRGLPERLPSPAVFDHVITVAQVGEKKIWVDPTISLQGGQENLSVPAYGFGLELRPGTTDLTPVEVPPEAISITEATYTYKFDDATQPANLKINTRYSGSEAESLRRTLTSTSLEELQSNYVDYYTSENHSLEPLDPLEIADDRKANSVEVKEHYRVTYTDPSGELDLATLPLLLESDLSYPDEVEGRRTPWALVYPLRRDETIILKNAEAGNYTPVNAEEDNKYFKFTVSTEAQPGIFKLTYHLETKLPEVAPEDLPSYIESVDSMWGELGYALWGHGDKIVGDADLRSGAAVAFGAGAALLFLYAALVAFVLHRQGLLGGRP